MIVPLPIYNFKKHSDATGNPCERIVSFNIALKTEWYDSEDYFTGVKGFACLECNVERHNPFTWITCRIGMLLEVIDR